MAQATVKTVQYIDPRIEPQPDPVYDYVIGPTQNQYYKLSASGRSDSSLTFNNLTTLGIDRAYLDTFELELGVTITFNLGSSRGNAYNPPGPGQPPDPFPDANKNQLCPAPCDWTFQSFPFNTCCDEARVNINGGAFFSQPMCYVRAKERYMDQASLSKCYENVCPIHRPICQTEAGRKYQGQLPSSTAKALHNYAVDNLSGITSTSTSTSNSEYVAGPPIAVNTTTTTTTTSTPQFGCNGGIPTRYGRGVLGMLQSQEGLPGGFNNSILVLGAEKKDAGGHVIGYENYYRKDANTTIVKVKWREPLFVSPFSSRYDATYGRPLYNITSMDFAFNMMDLGNMIRISNYGDMTVRGAPYVSSYNIHIDTAMLCYQVMTIPSILQKPLTTLVPYRRFVPYITEYNSESGTGSSGKTIDAKGVDDIEILSGVYTLNEVPTAIWVFCAPTKDLLQTNNPCSFTDPATEQPDIAWTIDNVNRCGNYDCNKLFAYLRHVNISMANTTQILNTAEELDLYRIAKANGCQDSFWSWGGRNICWPAAGGLGTAFDNDVEIPQSMFYGAGSVLRLRPGVDLIVPDIPLIPGANANNMVLQVRARFDIPPHPKEFNKFALWLLFEYVGVAAISPGQCEITMNPLGTGEIVAVSPVMSATSNATEGALEGAGFWDNIRRGARIAAQISDTGIISRILRAIPGMGNAADWAEKHGLGAPAAKRGRTGGAVIGKGLNDWV